MTGGFPACTRAQLAASITTKGKGSDVENCPRKVHRYLAGSGSFLGGKIHPWTFETSIDCETSVARGRWRHARAPVPSALPAFTTEITSLSDMFSICVLTADEAK